MVPYRRLTVPAAGPARGLSRKIKSDIVGFGWGETVLLTPFDCVSGFKLSAQQEAQRFEAKGPSSFEFDEMFELIVRQMEGAEGTQRRIQTDRERKRAAAQPLHEANLNLHIAADNSSSKFRGISQLPHSDGGDTACGDLRVDLTPAELKLHPQLTEISNRFSRTPSVKQVTQTLFTPPALVSCQPVSAESPSTTFLAYSLTSR